MNRFFTLIFTVATAISGSAQNLQFFNTEKQNGHYNFTNKSLITYSLENEVNYNDSFTISVWMRHNSLSSTKNDLINLSDEPCGAFQQTLYANQNKLELFSGESCGANFNFITTSPPALNKWYNYTIVTHNKQLSLYINGNKAGQCPVSTFATDTAKRIYFGGHHTRTDFFGQLKNIAFYNKELTEQEIKNIYKQPNTIDKNINTIESNTYKWKKFIPPGFSMISIPFSHGQNTVNDIFGAGHDFVIYEYTFTNNFFEGEWVINAYDSDFEEWDYPSHILPAGTAVWILNTSFFVQMIEFTGSIPKKWKKSPPNPTLP